MRVSECCQAPAVGASEDMGICPECKEHCEYVEEEEEDPVRDMVREQYKNYPHLAKVMNQKYINYHGIIKPTDNE